MEAHVRAKVARGAEEAAAASVTAKREIERRLAEVRGPCGEKPGIASKLYRIVRHRVYEVLVPDDVLHD